MFRVFASLLLLLLAPASSLGKSSDVYPTSCNDLWASVQDTLLNQRNYKVVFLDDLNQRASFVVVGNLTQFTDRVSLAARDSGCELKSSFLEVGSDNDDFRQFHHRLAQSLAKLQAAKAKPPSTRPGEP